MVLLIVIALHCDIGWDTSPEAKQRNPLLRRSFVNMRKRDDKTKEFKPTKLVIDRTIAFRDLFEMILCMEAWMRLPQIPKYQVVQQAKNQDSMAKESIRTALRLFSTTVDRQEGLGMNLTKTHAPLHAPDNILDFGVLNNWHTGPLECSHKVFCKKPAKQTQKRQNSLEEQVSERTVDRMKLDYAKNVLTPSMHHSHQDVSSGISDTASKIKMKLLFRDGEYSAVRTEWQVRRTASRPAVKPDHQVLQFLGRKIKKCTGPPDHPKDLTIPLYTEHKVEGRLYRAHPAYRGTTPRYDWVRVSFYDQDRQEFFLNTARILIFVDLRLPIVSANDKLPEHLRGYHEPGTYAIVQCLENESKYSPILRKGCLNKTFYAVNTEHLHEPATVIENFGCPQGSDEFFVIRPMSSWAIDFTGNERADDDNDEDDSG